MAFVTVADELLKKSFTSVENKFITKYMPVLEPVAVKVYLYALYLYQSGISSHNLADFAAALCISENEATGYFEYLEEFELISILSRSPFEIKILDAENTYGTPKKYKPEKYSDFTKSAQQILKGRMIPVSEFSEYFRLMEDYGFEQHALIMIISYCANLKGDDIRFNYIKKVAKSFAEENVTTAKKVDEKLSAFTSATPAIVRIFGAAGIKRNPEIDDEKLFYKWTDEMNFSEQAIICAAKQFGAKSAEKLDDALSELYKNKKFDVKEIENYCKTRSSVYALTKDIAENLGVYMRNPAPYVENFVNAWCDSGYSFDSLRKLANFCFLQGGNSFEFLGDFIEKLYEKGIVADASVNEFIQNQIEQDKLVKKILEACGLTRKIIARDRDYLQSWRSWSFTDEQILEAAALSAGKSNPLSYMNAVLSGWKKDGYESGVYARQESYAAQSPSEERAAIERHYYNLRHAAEERAEKILKRATDDEIYGDIRKKLNSLSIKLAFAEIRDESQVESLSGQIAELERAGDERLQALHINKADFTPRYKCEKCSDTGYTPDGAPCSCLKKFLAANGKK